MTIHYSRFLLLFIGIALSGLGQALTILAGLGLAPWDVLHSAVSLSTNLTIGHVIIVTSVLTVLFWIPLRQKPGIGTIAGMFLVGYCVDLSMEFMPTPESLVARWVYLIAGIFLFGVGISSFLSSHLGVGPRDGLMVGICAKGYSIQGTRICIDGSAMLVGWLFGGSVGLGTILITFGVGPVVQLTPVVTNFFRRMVTQGRQATRSF